jgi:hypothetical protein
MGKCDYLCSEETDVIRNMKHMEITGQQDYLALNKQDIIILDIKHMRQGRRALRAHLLLRARRRGAVHRVTREEAQHPPGQGHLR